MHDVLRFYDRYLLTAGLNLKAESEILLNTLPPRTALIFLPSHSKGPYISCRMSNDWESFKRGSVLEHNIKSSIMILQDYL